MNPSSFQHVYISQGSDERTFGTTSKTKFQRAKS